MEIRPPKIVLNGMPLEDYVRNELLTPDLLIEPQRIVLAHRALREALDDPAIPYLVRKQGSKGSWSLRGKESREPGVDKAIVFTDNSPPIWLHHYLRFQGPGVALINLLRCLGERTVPAAHSFKRVESDREPEWPLLNRLMGGVYPPVWTAGWKLSHILPCSPHLGRTDDPLALLRHADLKKYFRVRFLRNLSPFNYFLTPSPKRHVMMLEGNKPTGKDLGEDERVITWVIRLLHDEVFATLPEAQSEFLKFLSEAGFGASVVRNSSNAAVTVAAKTDVSKPKQRTLVKLDSPKTPKVRRTPVISLTQAFNPPADYDIYQVNEAVSRDTYSGLLVAPDGNKGGWRRLREVAVGDVIFHNQSGRIHAVSVVEPFNPDDERITSRSQYIKAFVQTGGAYLVYAGKHFSIPDRPEPQYVTCLTKTVATLDDPNLRSAVQNFGGYALLLKPENFVGRPELLELAARARMAGIAGGEEDDDNEADTASISA